MGVVMSVSLKELQRSPQFSDNAGRRLRMDHSIGFIGLGVMGAPMAKNLIRRGHDLIVCERGRSAEVKELGATVMRTCKEVAERAEIIITMLPDSPDVEGAVLGPNGVFEGTKSGSTLIDMSTISPISTRKIAEEAKKRGVKTLDAPVSGGEKGAIDGTLTIMVGGSKQVFDECLPILQGLGKNIVYCGDAGSGQVVKACNQVLVAGVLEAASEAIVLGAKAGVEPEIVLKVIASGYAMRVLEVRGPLMLKADFTPGFRTRLHHKDLGIALATGSEYGVPLPVTSLIREMMGAMKASGQGEYDHSGILTVLQELARLETGTVRP